MKNLNLILVFVFCSSSALARTMPGDVPEEAQPSVTYDIGASTGKTGDVTYTELNLGLNWWFHPSFAWRNAVFGRFLSGQDTLYGLDTSIRGSHTFELGESASFNVFAGPGWRFINKGTQAPIAEGGLVLHLGGLSIGGGVKAVFNKVIDKNAEDDTQYFIILGGGGAL